MTSTTPEILAMGPQAKNPGGLGVRHLQVLLMFSGVSIAYILRVNMSVAIVAMSNSTTANPDIVDFGWDASTQSIILSSFFWAYVLVQLPVGQIAHKWSATKLWAFGMIACGVINMLIPIAATSGGWMAVCACRIAMGFCQGCVIPCAHTLLGKWAPPSERGRLGTSSHTGYLFGTIIGLLISGVLAASAAGWPSIFYIGGTITIAWSVAFLILAADSPGCHRFIKPAERDYIEESLGQVGVTQQPPTPWRAILTSVPLWALCIVHCAQNLGFWMLLTEIPTYMNAILGFNISKNGFMSAIPYLTMWLLTFPFSWLSDYVLKRGWVTRGVARKVSNSIGHWGPAVALLCLGYITDNTPLAVAVLIIAVGLDAGSLSGWQINHLDLSPNYAGTLMSITNTFANIMSIIAPLIAGFILTDTSDVTQWRTVFTISSGIYFTGNSFFVLFGKAEVQWWNDQKLERNAEIGKRTSHQSQGSNQNTS